LVRIAYALTIGALLLGSASSLALRPPASAPSAPSAQSDLPLVLAQAAEPIAAPVSVRPPAGAPMSFAELAERLQPAVVNISTRQRIEVGRTGRFGTPPQSMEELFRRFGGPQTPETDDDGQPVTRQATSLGSGFIVDPSGLIVTNNHVITGRGDNPVDEITVTLSDRREFRARVVGRDPLTDVAVIKIDAPQPLPFVRFGDSRAIRVGDWALAIGNPFGLGGTVTAGIVSAKGRNIGAGQYDRYLQTDASINQGNSGGPLFDLAGNVVGINTVILSPTGGNIGLGFAVPSELARPIVEQLSGSGRVRRGYLGVGIQPVGEDIAASLGLPKNRGEIVANVEPGGPAARAGIRQGDVIVRVGGQDVTEDNTLSYIVANSRIGAAIPIELIRDGRRQTLNATIAERPSEQQIAGGALPESATPGAPREDTQQAARRSLGVSLQALTPEVRQQLRVGTDVQGLVIAGLNPNSDAAAKGLRRGDIIRRINNRDVTTPEQAAAVVDDARKAGRSAVLLLVQRGQNPATFIGVELLPVAGGARGGL
jgi:serine protease Do